MCWPHATLRPAIVGLPTLSSIVVASIVFAMALIIAQPSAIADRAHVVVGGPFALTAPDGTTVTDETYRGKWLLVFFGYTSCPDICPTTLSEIAGALEKFGPGAVRLQAIFITVDPKRDTPEVMGKYTAAFDARIIGLTGSPQQIAAAEKAYGVDSASHEKGAGGEDYVVDHSSYIYVMDPSGKFVRGLDFATPSGRISEILHALIARSDE